MTMEENKTCGDTSEKTSEEHFPGNKDQLAKILETGNTSMQSDGAARIIIAAASTAGKFTNQEEVEDHAFFAAKIQHA